MPSGNYRHPPITEAVIDIQFAPGMPQEILRRLQRQLRDRYPDADDLFDVTITVRAERPDATQRLNGVRLSSTPISSDIFLLKHSSITTSRLAPYPGWEPFFATAMRNFQAWRDIAGRRHNLNRVATRYINRIDMPTIEGRPVNVFDFIAVEPKLPGRVLGSRTGFALNVAGQDPEDPTVTVSITVSEIPSPLIAHKSVILDIDVFVTEGLPDQDEDLIGLCTHLRLVKNRTFEAVITDRARELFDRHA